MKKIIAAALGEDVHIAGIANFLNLADKLGHKTTFLGPAVSIDTLIEKIKEENPDIVGVSYRLTPKNAKNLLDKLQSRVEKEGLDTKEFVFAGTPPVIEVAKDINLFSQYFDSGETERAISFLKGENIGKHAKKLPSTLIERIKAKKPFPLIRHHFGLPSLEDTIKGIKKISESGELDVISIAQDQISQQYFFHPEMHDPSKAGAGGVPIRSKGDLQKIYEASQRGNFPLLRAYAGTKDLIKLAGLYKDTINNAWAAIPLFWFNKLDGRGDMELKESIEEHQKLMKWCSEEDVPVEILEAHHWSLRNAPDNIAAAAAYIGAYNAKKFGAKNLLNQYMFNTPAGTSMKMDLSKMLATQEMISELKDNYFKIYTQTRAGLLGYPVDQYEARGQLASSVMLQMALDPDIIHVVSFSEADHAATPKDVIESCKIAKQVVKRSFLGQLPDMTYDPKIQKRKCEIISEAKKVVDYIKSTYRGAGDPLIDSEHLSDMVKKGVLDTPQLVGSPHAAGRIKTLIIDGACYTVDNNGKKISEAERLKNLD